MEKYVYDEKNGLWYELNEEYYVPCIALSEAETRPVGKYGRMRKRYLQGHRKGLYAILLMEGQLQTHLADIEEEAQDFIDVTIRETAKAEGVNEELKAADQMEWVRRMNNIRNRVEEILFREIIHN